MIKPRLIVCLKIMALNFLDDEEEERFIIDDIDDDCEVTDHDIPRQVVSTTE